jgi:hypothetical protein
MGDWFDFWGFGCDAEWVESEVKGRIVKLVGNEIREKVECEER